MSAAEYSVLDLFCGLGGFSSAFAESERWDVTTVDIEPEFDPDITADVFDLRPSDFDREYDVVVASPPCTQFSRVAWSHGKRISTNGEPLTEAAADSIALVRHTLGLIHGLNPEYWFLENPQGALRWVIGEPTGVVDQCAYGHYTKKQTDLWGEHPVMEYKKCPHENHMTGDGYTDFEGGPSSRAERAKMPSDLSESIRVACETALDGEGIEQYTLDTVA